jgi:hypothetical protein
LNAALIFADQFGPEKSAFICVVFDLRKSAGTTLSHDRPQKAILK